MKTPEELLARYGKSEQGNFYVCDTIGVPHPYCITPKHINHAADYFGGMLGEAAIVGAEEHGAHCGVLLCRLKYREHKQALLIACHTDLKGEDGKGPPELIAYLNKIKQYAIDDRYEGFAFVDRRSK